MFHYATPPEVSSRFVRALLGWQFDGHAVPSRFPRASRTEADLHRRHHDGRRCRGLHRSPGRGMGGVGAERARRSFFSRLGAGFKKIIDLPFRTAASLMRPTAAGVPARSPSPCLR